MEINIGEERIVELRAVYTREQIMERALARRIDAFGQMAKLFQRPRAEDIEIGQVQNRYESFWVASGSAHYAYDWQHSYRLEVAPAVQSITLNGQTYAVSRDKGNSSIQVMATDHCVETLVARVVLDSTRGEDAPDMARYLTFARRDVAQLAELEKDGAVVMAPEVKGSFVVRKLVSQLVKTFQADQIHEESIDVVEVALYCRPIYAVEYKWTSKNKRQVLEFDALTGECRAEPGEIKTQVKRILEADALFDIGSDAAGTLIPGGGIAVKLGRIAAKKALR